MRRLGGGLTIILGSLAHGGAALIFFFQWGPEPTTSIRRVTGKGTVAVKTASCTSGTLTFSVREH